MRAKKHKIPFIVIVILVMNIGLATTFCLHMPFPEVKWFHYNLFKFSGVLPGFLLTTIFYFKLRSQVNSNNKHYGS